MSYRPLGQGLAGIVLLAHATFLYAAASDAILVESRGDSLIVLPNAPSVKVPDESPTSASGINAFGDSTEAGNTVASDSSANSTVSPTSLEATQAAGNVTNADVTLTDPRETSVMRAQAELLPFQAPTEDAEMAGIESQYQQQILQQEVQTLRGLVEEMQFQLQRMKKTQDDRYLELDGRFQALSGSGSANSAVANNMNAGAGQLAVAKTSNVTVDINAAVIESNEAAVVEAAGTMPLLPTGQSEKDLYDTALELIRNRQYDIAITQLQAVIDRYPAGDYAPNAYYWLGEVYAARPQPNLEKAQQALAQVISSYPGHRKVPDAAFKLGKVYHLMGDCDKSRDLLSQVADQQQGKTVGKLAASYLRDSMLDCQS
jgi:tol-pal system protein YbgF